MISIVIPTLNRPRSLVKLIDSLQKQMVSVPFEVLVVYNSSTEAATTPLRPTPHLKILYANQRGVNHARNMGISLAQGSIILLIDDDCEPTNNNYLQRHWDLHLQHPDLIAIGGPYLLAEKSTFWDHIYHINNENWMASNLVAPERSLALLGGNASYKKAAFTHGFLFTEEIVYGGSETPLNTLLTIKYGAFGYFKDLAILHHTKMSLFSLINKAFKQGSGAALQTQIFGHQLKKTTELSEEINRRSRIALEVYAFIFMIGYKSKLLNRSLLIIFFQEFWTRCILRQKQEWEYRFQSLKGECVGKTHEIMIKSYWSGYTFLNKSYWRLYSVSCKVLLFFKKAIYGAFCFWTSLWEKNEDWDDQKTWPIRLNLRLQIIARKMGWLVLKTVRLR